MAHRLATLVTGASSGIGAALAASFAREPSRVLVLVADVPVGALVAAPVLLASLAVGLVVGIIQAATSVNEQTLTFVPKLGVIALVLVVLGGSKVSDKLGVIDSLLDALFRIVAMVMRLAPIGAGAGVAFTISKYGLGTVWSLAYLMLAVYVTSIIFVVFVIGSICRWTGFSLTKVL